MLASYPVATDYPRDEVADEEIGWVQAFVLGVRQIRGEMNIKPSSLIRCCLRNASRAGRTVRPAGGPAPGLTGKACGLESITVLPSGTHRGRTRSPPLPSWAILSILSDGRLIARLPKPTAGQAGVKTPARI